MFLDNINCVPFCITQVFLCISSRFSGAGSTCGSFKRGHGVGEALLLNWTGRRRRLLLLLYFLRWQERDEFNADWSLIWITLSLSVNSRIPVNETYRWGWMMGFGTSGTCWSLTWTTLSVNSWIPVNKTHRWGRTMGFGTNGKCSISIVSSKVMGTGMSDRSGSLSDTIMGPNNLHFKPLGAVWSCDIGGPSSASLSIVGVI